MGVQKGGQATSPRKRGFLAAMRRDPSCRVGSCEMGDLEWSENPPECADINCGWLIFKTRRLVGEVNISRTEGIGRGGGCNSACRACLRLRPFSEQGTSV